MKSRLTATLILLGIISMLPAHAAKYVLQNKQDSLVGEVITVQSELKDTLLDIARKYGLGYQDMKLLNPELDTWMPGADKEVKLPLKFILPNAERSGIVLNIPEMRLYYYPSAGKNGEQSVITYPLGVGREGWSTPFIKTKIIEKKKHPNWYPPESIRQEHEAAGDPLPKIVEAGPDNPLGDHAMRLGLPEYLIHGTNKPFGIGMRVSHGCIRLYPEDIAELFDEVKLGTRVEIVNQPYKIGIHGDNLYLEVHPYLDEDAELYENNLTPVVKMIIDSTGEGAFDIDWDEVRKTVRHPTGVPTKIGSKNTVIASVEKAIDTTLDAEHGTPELKSADPAPDSIVDEAVNSQQEKLELRLDSSIKPDKFYR